MVDAVKKVAPEFEGIVQWREHKIKYRESFRPFAPAVIATADACAPNSNSPLVKFR